MRSRGFGTAGARWLLAIATMSAAILWLRATFYEPNDAIGLMLVVPASLAAARLGMRTGVLVATVLLGALVGWQELTHPGVFPPIGYATRVVIIVGTAMAVGYAFDSRRRAGHELEVLVDTVPDLMGIVGYDRRILVANDAFRRLLGYGRSALAQMTVLDMIHPDDRERASAAGDRARRLGEQVVNLELRMVSAAGATLWIDFYATPVEAQHRIYFVGRDVTERKLLEQRTRRLLADVQQARDEQREQIAGELHDFALQHLTAALMRIRFALDHEPAGPSLDRITLQTSEEMVAAAISAIRRTMRGLKPDVAQQGSFTEGLARAVRETEAAFHASVDLRIEGEHEPAHEVRLLAHRLVIEALRNAAKHAQAREVSAHVRVSPDAVTCCISDDGRGLEHEVDVDSQSVPALGMGISLLLEQVVGRDGSYRFRSGPGSGTRLEFSVPAGAVTRAGEAQAGATAS